MRPSRLITGSFLTEALRSLRRWIPSQRQKLRNRLGGQCATLAAQVAHVTFYLEVLERYILNEEAGVVDWGVIWRTVR